MRTTTKTFGLLVLMLTVGVMSMPAAAMTWTFDDPAELDDFSTDRTEPTNFEIRSFDGDNRLYMGVFGEDQSTGGAYYYTEGRSYSPATPIAGQWMISGELYLNTAWSQTPPPEYRTDIWGLTKTAEGEEAAYPILSFGQTIENDPDVDDEDDITLAGGFQVWDAEAGGWVAVADAAGLFGTWVEMTIMGSPSSFDYYINGDMVYSDTTTAGSATLDTMYLQVKNYGTGVNGENYDYSTYYDNITVAAVPEPLTMITLAGAAGALGGYIRRRRTA